MSWERRGSRKIASVPDHQFIVATISDMVDICSGKQVVRHIGSESVGVVVVPTSRRRDAADLADKFFGESSL